MAACKLLWCPKSAEELRAFMEKDFGPLLMKHWEAEERRTGQKHGLDVPAFMACWEQRGIALIMAYEKEKAVGFMPLFIFRPLFTLGQAITIERWYADNREAEKSMFDYLLSVLPVIGADQVHIAQHSGQKVPEHITLDDSDDYHMSRLGGV